MERHLAAILSADIAGYSRLMQRDEAGTLAAIKKIRQETVIPLLEEYRGKSIKLMGDGELMEFPSINDAVIFAVEVQLAQMKRNRDLPPEDQIRFRIGINIGDVIVDDDDIYGDGVNLASRVENIAEPGGICLTNTARSQVVNQLGLQFRDMGPAQIKGFDSPIQVFSVVLDDDTEQSLATTKATIGSGARKRGKRLLSSKRRLAAAAAVGAAALYGVFGSLQVAMSGGEIHADHMLCPVIAPFSDQNAPLNLGAIYPANETHGKRMSWGIRTAVEQYSENYSFPVKYHFVDSSDGVKAVLAGLERFKRAGVQAIIGPMNSENAYHAKKWGNANRIPVVSPLATASYLTEPGEFDYFFRATMSDGARARNLVQWIVNKGLQNNPYLIHEWSPPIEGIDGPEIYGASQATAAKRHLGRVETIRFTRGSENSMLEAASRVENDGRAIIIFGYTSNIKIIIQSLQERGVENDIFLMGVVTKTLEEADFPMPEKLHVVTPDVSEARSLADSAQLQREFEDDNPDVQYDISTYYGYDSVTILLDAVEKARQKGCGNRLYGSFIAEALRETPNKRRKMLNGGFMNDVQEVFFRYDGLRMIDGRFRHVGIDG